jgi:hypothetical protein
VRDDAEVANARGVGVPRGYTFTGHLRGHP